MKNSGTESSIIETAPLGYHVEDWIIVTPGTKPRTEYQVKNLLDLYPGKNLQEIVNHLSNFIPVTPNVQKNIIIDGDIPFEKIQYVVRNSLDPRIFGNIEKITTSTTDKALNVID